MVLPLVVALVEKMVSAVECTPKINKKVSKMLLLYLQSYNYVNVFLQ